MAKTAKPAAPRAADDQKTRVKPAKVAEAAAASPLPKVAKRAKAAGEPELELDNAAPEPAGVEGPKWPRRKLPSAEIHPTLIALGQIVRATRKAKGMTQLQLAQRCGYNAAAIFMVEAGRQNMTVKSLMTVATALDLGISDLFPRDTPHMSAKLLAAADAMGDIKGRVVAHLQLLDRLADDLREQAGIVDRT
jgi:transcriptional regulator with XRE-family HTH domain